MSPWPICGLGEWPGLMTLKPFLALDWIHLGPAQGHPDGAWTLDGTGLVGLECMPLQGLWLPHLVPGTAGNSVLACSQEPPGAGARGRGDGHD